VPTKLTGTSIGSPVPQAVGRGPNRGHSKVIHCQFLIGTSFVWQEAKRTGSVQKSDKVVECQG
jgi:hypothetical protein